MTVDGLEEIRRNWADRGFSCDIWVDSPGQEWKDFVHPVDELVFVLEGDLTIDDIEMTAGDFHFAPKGSSHQSVSTVNGVLMLLQIPAY